MLHEGEVSWVALGQGLTGWDLGLHPYLRSNAKRTGTVPMDHTLQGSVQETLSLCKQRWVWPR